jgi:hypothetical protein
MWFILFISLLSHECNELQKLGRDGKKVQNHFFKGGSLLNVPQKNTAKEKAAVSFAEMVVCNDQCQCLPMREAQNKKSFTLRCPPQVMNTGMMETSSITSISRKRS